MGTYYAALGGSRILNANRVDQSGADDADVAGWNKANDIIVAVNINSAGKDTIAAQYKLRWRDVTDVGAFADLASTGECKFGATDLVNGAAILVGGRKCDSIGGDTWQSGEEVEGTALSDSIDLADEYETEIHFSVSLADADDGHQYEFELYDGTRGASVGTLGAAITIQAGATTYYQNTGQGSISPSGSLPRQTYKTMGGYAVTSTGALASAALFSQGVGGGTISPFGILESATIFLCNVGGYALSMVGGLVKQTHKTIGGHSMSITGGFAKQVYKAVGGYAVAISGTLDSATIFFQSVGGYAVQIAGAIAKKTSVYFGKGSVSPEGNISKQTSKSIGGATVEPAGTLTQSIVIKQDSGGGVISPSGILGTVATFILNVGEYALTPIGTLIKDYTSGGGGGSMVYHVCKGVKAAFRSIIGPVKSKKLRGKSGQLRGKLK